MDHPDAPDRGPSAVPSVVRLRGPADILGVLPWRLGFHPSDCLVVVCLEGERRRDRLVMRSDLGPPAHDAAVAADLAGRARHVGASAVVAVVYTEAPDVDGRLARADLADALVDALDAEQVEASDVLLVRGDRWWSYLCGNDDCCPSAGTPLLPEATEAATRYAAETVVRGGAVLADREAVRRSITPSDHAVARAVRGQAAVLADQTISDALAAGGLPALRGLALGRLWALRTRWAQGDRHPPDPHDAALVVLGLRDKQTRDQVMTAALDDDVESVIDLLSMLARQADDLDAAPLCTVLGWLAYTAGQGALATVAVERALCAEPGYEMARLLEHGMDGMVRPADLRAISAAVRADLRGDGVAEQAG